MPRIAMALTSKLKIIQLCEVRWILDFERRKMIDQIIDQEASDIEQKVKELQVQVADLMVVIVDHVTPKDEEDSKATVVKTPKGIDQDIKQLLRCGLWMVVSYGF